MRRWGQRVGALLLCGLLGFAASARAEARPDLARVREAIASGRARIDRYLREEQGLFEALEAMEGAVALLAEHVREIARRAGEARVEAERADAERRRVEARLAVIEAAMGRRAAALYRSGRLGPLPVLFSAGDLREFLARVQTLRRLLAHDGELLGRHLAESQVLLAVRERFESATTERESAQQRHRERSAELARERVRTRELTEAVRGDRARERRALAELENAARALEEAVGALPAPVAESGEPAGPGFATLRGRLLAPVSASVARGFGRVVDAESRTVTFRKGVDFEVPEGSDVQAVASGLVRYAGRFRGYGLVVILDHGDRYFSVYAHLSRIDVEVGARLAGGEHLGASGETGSLSGPHLYFEIRRGAEALDPRVWLAGFTRGVGMG
ncbi:MAG: peptidoglycan DD-metalloendopeptidase family protein [Myxococcales bacterium]|nr:peptidoglycan DD-metalloendopeptidase family protein [Myxococcales bacterium]